MKPVSIDLSASRRHGRDYFRAFVADQPMVDHVRCWLHVRVARPHPSNGQSAHLLVWELDPGVDEMDWSLAVQRALAECRAAGVSWMAAHVDDPAESGVDGLRVSSFMTATSQNGVNGVRMPYRWVADKIHWMESSDPVCRERLKAATPALLSFARQPTR